MAYYPVVNVEKSDIGRKEVIELLESALNIIDEDKKTENFCITLRLDKVLEV